MNTAACSMSAMTRAADRLIVGGCLPGNMRSVRPLSWYDLITKGLANSGLQLQEIETAARRGEALCAARGDRAAGRSCCCAVRAGADGAAQLAADPGAAGDVGGKSAAAIRPRR